MKNDKKHYLLLLIFFALFIGAFTVFDFIKPSENFSEFENRYLKQRPKITWSSLMDNSYTQNYEGYINDQFVFRNKFIDLKSKAEALLLKIENNGVIYGKNNMLFEKFNSLDEEQLEKNIEFVENFSKDKNVTFAIVPSAYEIYPENLPYGTTMVMQKAMIDRIYQRLESLTDTLDLVTSLKQNKDDYIYYRTDHHWTTNGAFVSYQDFCKMKNLDIPSDLKFTEVDEFYGTYFNKCKNSSITPDAIEYLDVTLKTVVDGVEKENYLDFSKFDERDKYAAFLHGNNGVTVLSSGEQREKGKILVIKDSFANCFVPFLTYNYSEVYVIDLRSLPKGLTELVENNEFDDILILYNFINFQSDTNLYRLKY